MRDHTILHTKSGSAEAESDAERDTDQATDDGRPMTVEAERVKIKKYFIDEFCKCF